MYNINNPNNWLYTYHPPLEILFHLSISTLRIVLSPVVLENNMITGKLPSTLGHLKSLREMLFSNNQFVGQIPSSFGNFMDIQTVELSNNKLVGPLPPQLAKATISNLDMSNNPLGLLVTLPYRMFRLNVYNLSLANTGIKGQLPQWLSKSTSMGHLDLSSNQLIGHLPSWMEYMMNLHSLNMSNNRFYSNQESFWTF